MDSSICKTCEKVKTVEIFPTLEKYLECLEHVQSLVDSGSFEFVLKDCDIDKVRGENGSWSKDIINHVIRCKKCGQCFTCTANVYRGGGGFRKNEKE